MANVFLTVLGTGAYSEANYKYGENIYKTRFIQEALISEFCKTWSKDDKICVFLTKGAKEKNWNNDLEKLLKTLNLEVQIIPVDIKDGQNEEEIWEIFDELYKSVNENDSIIFDITHSFRSIPMLVIVFLNYAKVLKNVNLSGIYYGAFEAAKNNNGISPIFDLTPFSILQDWTNATNIFLQTGDSSYINELAQNQINPILKKTKGADENARAIQYVMKKLEDFSKLVFTNRLIDIVNPSRKYSFSYKLLKEKLGKCKNSFLKPLNPLFDKIENKINKFEDDDIRNGFSAVEWCINHNLIQQGYTLLQETIISVLINKLYGKEFLQDEEKRMFISYVINLKLRETIADETRYSKEEIAKIIDKIDLNFAKDIYIPISQLRNDLNHAGCRQNIAKHDDLIKKLKEYYEKVKNFNF